MAWEVRPFYSFSIQQQGVQHPDRFWHNSAVCAIGKRIPWDDRMTGTGGFPQCPECARM
jgi:hypothetical protein